MLNLLLSQDNISVGYAASIEPLPIFIIPFTLGAWMELCPTTLASTRNIIGRDSKQALKTFYPLLCYAALL